MSDQWLVVRDQQTGNIKSNSNISVTSGGDISATSVAQLGNYAILYLTSDQHFNGGSNDKILFDSSTITGLANDITVSSNQFVVHKNGMYMVSGQVTSIDDGAAELYGELVTIKKNGTTVVSATYGAKFVGAAISPPTTISFSVLLDLIANDTISFYYVHTSAVGQNLSGIALPNRATFAQMHMVAKT